MNERMKDLEARVEGIEKDIESIYSMIRDMYYLFDMIPITKEILDKRSSASTIEKG